MVHEQAHAGKRVAGRLRPGGRGGAKDDHGDDYQDERVPEPLHMSAGPGTGQPRKVGIGPEGS